MLTMRTIRESVLELMKGDLNLINDLAVELQKSHESIKRWIRTDSAYLGSPASLRIIRKHTKLTNEEILENNTTEL